jgi:hypothetical protein
MTADWTGLDTFVLQISEVRATGWDYFKQIRHCGSATGDKQQGRRVQLCASARRLQRRIVVPRQLHAPGHLLSKGGSSPSTATDVPSSATLLVPVDSSASCSAPGFPKMSLEGQV